MSSARPIVHLREPPSDLDALIEWFDRLSYSLVLLERYPPADLAGAVGRLDASVRDHLRRVPPERAPPDSLDGPVRELRRLVESDHARFEVSLDQLAWFLRRVTDDALGGHEQALGQYGRVLAEALRRHRTDERRLQEMSGSLPGDPSPEKP